MDFGTVIHKVLAELYQAKMIGDGMLLEDIQMKNNGHDFMHILTKNRENVFFLTPFMHLLDCAQIVPIKVKYFQIVPNETKNQSKKLNRINWLKSNHF